MSLSLCVGQLADCIAVKDRDCVRRMRRALEKINEVLKANELPEHHEPERVQGGKRWTCRIAGHYLTPLRRLAAHVRQRLINDEGDEDEFDTWPEPWDRVWSVGYQDPILEEYYDDGGELFDHLMYHSDYQGYYVPIDFDDPLYPRGELEEELGGPIGSTRFLLSDCEEVARMIHLPTDLDADSKCFDDAVTSAEKLGQGWWNYATESERCLKLIAACRKSLEWNSVIVLHG
jgi:hypothetical protein